MWTGRIAALGLTLGLLCSFTLWSNIGRTFPQCPLLFAGCPDWISCAFYTLALLSSIAIIFNKRIVLSGLLLTISISLLVLLDLNRFQPWVYEYLLIILINCFNSGPDKNESNTKAIALLLIAIYFFSGLEKFNWRFITAIGPWLIGLSDSTQVSFGNNATVMAGAATLAVCEVGLAVALANTKTRFLGLLGGIFMHLSIISMLGPRGHNAAVWPWNLIQIALLFHFLHLHWDLKQMLAWKKSNWPISLAITITCGLIPALGLVQKADAYPAFALYSGDTPMGILEFKYSLYSLLTARAKAVCQVDKDTGLWSIELADWALAESNSPNYPSTFCIVRSAESFVAQHPHQLIMLKIITYPKWTRVTRIQLLSLQNEK